MTTDIMHQPTPEFRDYLEGEVAREFRRHRSFARLRMAAVVFATLAAGTTAGIASAQIRQGAQRDSLLETAHSELALLGLRLELARSQVTDVRAKIVAGVVGSASMAAAESELRQMEALARRAQLNIEEIKATAMPPRDDLNAPLVSGRDFVTERMLLDLYTAQQRLTSAEADREEAGRRLRIGAVGELAVLDAELSVAQARSSLGTLAERQKLRKEFVEQGTPVEQLNRRLQQAQVLFDLGVAQEAVKVLRRRLDTTQQQRSVGLSSDVDILRAELDLRMRELELRKLADQLRTLRRPPER